MKPSSKTLLLSTFALSTMMGLRAAAAPVPQGGASGDAAAPAPADALAARLAPPALAGLAREVLQRSPELASLAADARALAQRAPRVKALPDPVAGLTVYLLRPETRVGPQQAMLSLSQRFPWFGTLDLRERAALLEAAAAGARLEARRLELVTEARRLFWEISFLDTWAEIVRQDRATLSHYEELARARYASGVGLDQAVVKLQAEITRDDSRLLDIAERRRSLVATVNALRDLPQSTAVPKVTLPTDSGVPTLAADELRRLAMDARPELAAAAAEVERATVLADLARKEYHPDITLGLSYVLVGTRTDAAGRAMPPAGNGRDILGLTGSMSLPVHRDALRAGVEEAVQRRLEAEESRRTAVTRIDRVLGDLTERIPLVEKQLRLFEDVLAVQARQALTSAESAYAAGTANALDLVDAERVLLDVHTSTARTRADLAIAVAQLEGAVAAPLPATEAKEKTRS